MTAPADDLTRADWALLAEAPLAAGAAVAVSDPGGGEREADALLRAWHEAAALLPQSDLVRRLVQRHAPDAQGGGGAPPAVAPDQLIGHALRLCRDAAARLAAVYPDDLPDYRRFVLHVAQRVAGAAAEGGLFGLGGEPVSGAERDVLRAIAAALDAGGGGRPAQAERSNP